MKYALILTLFLTFILACNTSPQFKSDQEIRSNEHNEHQHDQTNAELARELGADEYGMRKYVMAFLKTGPNRDQSDEEANAMQKAHLENIDRLAKEGVLVLAGPFFEKGELRGIYVFDVETVKEAEELTKTDPMIIAGRLVQELHPWYGSAALKKVNEIHDQIQSINITTK